MTQLYGKSIFYCLPPASPDQTGYPHTMICLGEGLSTWDRVLFKYKLLAVFPGTEDYLFRHNSNVTPDDCDIVLTKTGSVLLTNLFPNFYFIQLRKYLVYMDSEDGSKTHSWNPEFRQFDFLF